MHAPATSSVVGASHDRAAKDALNEQFARLGQAFGSGHRVELLDVLAQGERSVEALALETEMSVTLASAHLQVLRRVGLVATRREGARIYYRLSDDDVYRLLAALRQLATGRLAEAERAARAYVGEPDDLEPVSREELLRRAGAGDVVVIDVRPAPEYAQGHVVGAISMPLDELEVRLAELPGDREVVAYCRGAFCALAPQGVAVLRSHGRRARRLVDGFPEWRLAGLPVATGPVSIQRTVPASPSAGPAPSQSQPSPPRKPLG